MREFATIFASDEFSIDSDGDLDRHGASLLYGPDGSWDDDDVIDGVLRLVADYHRELGAAIGRRSFSPSQAELRQSPLGLDLRVLALAGTVDLGHELIRESAARVSDVLLRPVAAEGMVIPAWFWSSAIGRIVARAARATYASGELIPAAEAAARLDVDLEEILAWIADGAITSIPDEGGRPLVPREAVEHRRQIARELSTWRLDEHTGEDIVVGEARLAS